MVRSIFMYLPLYIVVHVHQILDGLYIIGDVGITVDGMLDSGAGNSKVDHIHRLVSAHHGIDQTGGKRVTAADAVENIEREELGFKGVALIPHEGLQTVLGAGVRIAYMAGDTLNVGVALNEALEDLILLFITGLQRNTVLPITQRMVIFVLPQVIRLNAQQNIYIRKALGTVVPGFLPTPELGAEIAIEAGGEPQFLGHLQTFQNKIGTGFVQRRSNTGHMEPGETAQQSGNVDFT